jgi:V8-like Glu-specific endopeptidase
MTLGQASAGTHAPAPAVTSRVPDVWTAVHGLAVTGHLAAVTAGQQADVRRYWTRARMEHAVPLRPAVTSKPPARPVTQRSRVTSQVTRHTAATRHTPVTRNRPASRNRPVTVPVAQNILVGTGKALAVPPQAPLRAPQQTAATTGALWSSGGAVARTTGKVFFSMGSNDYVCSGSTVASGNSDVVVTAGHCVKNGTGVWATNWTFVPGYASGNDPYGSFSANKFYVASQWSTQADNDYDVAFVTLNPAQVGGAQVTAVHEVGGQGVEFGSAPSQVTVFGYPADAPYNGQQLYYCSGTVSPDPYQETDDTGVTCVMTAGSSGGPWLAGFDPATGTGIITSVSSFKYSTNDQILYGTPFGPVAQELYEAAESG